MIQINPDKAIQQRLSLSIGLDRYEYLEKHLFSTDVSKDEHFQRIFNGFYMVRRNEEWRREYYRLFEEFKKNSSVSFSMILRAIFERTGNVEESFSSKMLATISPDMPIWDRYVLLNLGLTPPSSTDSDRIENTEKIYSEIVKWYGRFLETDNAITCIRKFDEVMPDYSWVSDAKKIDFYLWSIC